METFSALLAICAGISAVPGEFPAQRPVTRSFDVFFDLRPNKRLSKQSWGWWSETPSSSLWHHRNDMVGTGGRNQHLGSSTVDDEAPLANIHVYVHLLTPAQSTKVHHNTEVWLMESNMKFFLCYQPKSFIISSNQMNLQGLTNSQSFHVQNKKYLAFGFCVRVYVWM